MPRRLTRSRLDRLTLATVLMRELDRMSRSPRWDKPARWWVKRAVEVEAEVERYLLGTRWEGPGK